MTEDEEREVLEKIRAANAKNRGYASFFSWPLDRDLEEASIASIC